MGAPESGLVKRRGGGEHHLALGRRYDHRPDHVKTQHKGWQHEGKLGAERRAGVVTGDVTAVHEGMVACEGVEVDLGVPGERWGGRWTDRRIGRSRACQARSKRSQVSRGEL